MTESDERWLRTASTKRAGVTSNSGEDELFVSHAHVSMAYARCIWMLGERSAVADRNREKGCCAFGCPRLRIVTARLADVYVRSLRMRVEAYRFGRTSHTNTGNDTPGSSTRAVCAQCVVDVGQCSSVIIPGRCVQHSISCESVHMCVRGRASRACKQGSVRRQRQHKQARMSTNNIYVIQYRIS